MASHVTKTERIERHARRPRSSTPQALRSRAELVTVSAAGIARIADEVARARRRSCGSLDAALSDMNDVVASLIDTAGQAESATNSSEGMVSSVNEIAASIEQVSANTASLSSSIAQTAASAQQSSASIQSAVASAQEMSTAAQQVAASVAQMAAGTKAVTQRHRVPHIGGERNRRVDRRNFAVDRGRRRQRDRPRGRL